MNSSTTMMIVMLTFLSSPPLSIRKMVCTIAYQRDIPKLDRKIAKDTFAFYDHLLQAERDRSLIYEINRQGDVRNLTDSELRRQEILAQNVARELNITVSLLTPLKEELDTATSYKPLV